MSDHIDVRLRENRSFAPPAEFARQAVVGPGDEAALRERASRDPEGYWAEAARGLEWFKAWDRVLEWNPPEARWFTGGKLNASWNCLDRHLKTQPGKTAILWEGEPGETARWSYAELHGQVERFTALLHALGLRQGDRVAIYLPMVPEAV